MNNKIDKADFSNIAKTCKIGSVGKTSRLCKNFLLASSLALSVGCSSISTISNNDKISNSQLSINTSSPAINSITTENIKDIVLQKRSGAYNHPFESDSIVTLKFTGNKDSQQLIESDFEKYGLSTEALASSESIISNANKTEGSFHVRDPSFDGDLDVNLCVLDSNPTDSIYYDIKVAYHEIAHNSPSQNPNFLSLITGVSNEQRLYNENQSEAVGLIMALKAMNHDNKTDEEIDVFLQNTQEERDNVLKAKDGEINRHFVTPSVAFVQHLYKTNKDVIIEMDNHQVVGFSKIIAESITDMDYRDVLEDNVVKEDSVNKVMEVMQMLAKFSTDDSDKFSKLTESLKTRKYGNYSDVIALNGDFSDSNVNQLAKDVLVKTYLSNNLQRSNTSYSVNNMMKHEINITSPKGQSIIKGLNNSELVNNGVDYSSSNKAIIENLSINGFDMKVENKNKNKNINKNK